MTDVGRLYAETRGRITDLVREHEGDASRVVPHCPEWTVKDVVAHLAGICTDILEGRIDGVATDPWTARQVDERREKTLDDVLDEWSTAAPKVEELSQRFPEGAALQWLGDLTTHEHDIRCALGRPGARDSEAVAVGLPRLVNGFSDGFSPAFRIVTPEGDDLVMGEDEPEATVRVSRFDAFRALTGRRSEEQIAAFEWDGDYKPYIGAFSQGPFTMATSTIDE